MSCFNLVIPSDIDTAFSFYQNIKQLLETPTAMIIDVHVNEDENCYPMVAPGKSNSQMMGIMKRGTNKPQQLALQMETLTK